jgi:hypothetical protein
LARLRPSNTEHVFESTTTQDLQSFTVWKKVCDEILSIPFPPQSSSSDFTAEDIERDGRLSFSKYSNWEIVCQEILDTEYSHVYYQKCYDELRRRGKSQQEIFDMRKCAWYTAGWFNYPMMLWDWVSLDESDILRALDLLYEKKQINQEQRIEFVKFVELHAE